jgi:hypothetical protein
MDGAELRYRLDALGRPYTELAPLLGLSASGLHKQMNGQCRVSRQTEMLLEQLERGCLSHSAALASNAAGIPGQTRR